MNPGMYRDTEACYRAVKSKDRRFDGVFYTAVRTTGIYCRPSCPAITPKYANVTFHPTAAAAQQAGYRACRRCLPDATPGSPEWDVAADTASRTMRLISDGVVEREGVDGLAHRLGYSTRQLNRVVTGAFGAGPLALARERRAQTARVLVETTDLGFADIAFASGFASVRQFNDTMREVYAVSPSALRGRRDPVAAAGHVPMRLPVRTPFDAAGLLDFLARRAVPGVEHVDGGCYTRTLALPHGPGVVSLDLGAFDPEAKTSYVGCRVRLTDLRDLGAAVERSRRLLDADCDPVAVDEALGADPLLARLVRGRPGVRVPGSVDGPEAAVRAVLGQQVSVAGARTLAARLAAELGDDTGLGGPATRLFPTAHRLAELDPALLSMPRRRGRALTELCRAVIRGDLPLDRSADRGEVHAALLALPGIGPWTAGYVAMRALGDPDVFLAGDLGVREGLRTLGQDPRRGGETAQPWRPWRSYAQLHLWHLAAQGGHGPGARREGPTNVESGRPAGRAAEGE